MIGAFLLSSAVGLAVILSTRSWHSTWWAKRIVRYGIIVLAALVPIGMFLRRLGVGRVFDDFQSAPISIAGGILGGGGAIALLSLFVSLPAAGLLRRVLKTLAPFESVAAPKATFGISRRAIVEAAVAAVPIATLGLAAAGIGGAFVPTKLVQRPMKFANLPDELAGLKILQITDLHLGAFHAPSAIPDLVARARATEPDLVLFTGDICDYLPWLEEALHRFEEIAPRYGSFAVLGNHEHYRGAAKNLRIYDKTKIAVLGDAHHALDIAGKKLLLMGVDDPSGWGNDKDHYVRRADIAMSGAPSDADFTIGLCHRPKGFRALAERGVDLTLSGHTHGAQTGWNERSILEPFAEEQYLWGRYEHAGKQLYTSSGAGHWAAFRLACPSEAPLVVLEKA
ncbi:MAG: hypothetical protein HOW73_37540 [Polyangiaceae bacterium]|nr:hypothetical protein [Polyangiaceae bacterium]